MGVVLAEWWCLQGNDAADGAGGDAGLAGGEM